MGVSNNVGQIAKNLRDVHFGDNWTSVNLKDTLANVSWQQATTQIYNLNSIATLVFHINYYVNPVLKALQGETFDASDQFSFDAAPITCADEWQKLVIKVLTEAELLAGEIEKLEEDKLFEEFPDPEYGNYYRALLGIIEHTYYHLGQISLIKKVLSKAVDEG